ncbi:hypothetical protein RvY_09394 [Ramazzottius varieornatus]|uniref:Exonuclease domain-containing protein n=1 Tax=Ramazzottius varieornatus TaxID=947166 RepID=A0A1D1VIB2_RAMVA|nr:hypothetical protein RvY_09394 [Ramazzottius varieornatus]
MMGVADSTEELCQTSNLLRVLRALPEATERGLVSSDSFVIEDVGSAVQTWVEFLMERTHLEYHSHAAQAIMQENPLTSLFAWRMLETVHHSGCNHTNQLEKNVFAVSIQYHCQTNYGTPAFDNLLKSSINEYSEWTLTCGCGLQSKTFVSRQVLSYPECIAFTFHLEDGDNVSSFAQLLKAARTTSSKLDRGLCRYGASCSRPNCFFLHPHEMNSEEKHSNESEIPAALWIRQGFDGQTEVVTEQPADISNWLSYELSSVIHREHASGSEEKEDDCYSYTKTAPWSQWYRFGSNDVTPSTQAQAVQFDLEQKMPCVALYVRTGTEDLWPVCPVNPITREVFQKFSDLTASRRWYKPGDVVAVRETETFGPYNIVALDAEFVSLAGAENENLDDSFGKPAMLSVGRVTVVRGNGPLQDQLLMDEYVVARDKVANHLTKYSGIRPGDLSLNLSLKPLDTLKSVYVRLRYLVDAGVRFVGHGINTDFKILNLRVPQAQIIDTVQLYRLPGKRLISLRFLAWYFLRLHIQELSGHDSVEDAMASLYLYRWFERNRNTMISWDDSINSVQSVTFDELLQMMYQVGRSLDWKVSPNRS